MAFETLLPSKLVQIETKEKSTKKKASKRGCENCPLDKRKDLNKVFGKIRGKSLFIFGMDPGENENSEKKPFVGRAGEFLWHELRKVGIKRKHCDVDNVVRCYASDYEAGRRIMRPPNKQELHCCSLHTEKQLEKSKAKVYLILGVVAAKQLLGKEYRANTRILWSERLQAKVYAIQHPSYFIRGNMEGKVIKEWRKTLALLAADVKGDQDLTPYGYIESRDYQGITEGSAAVQEVALIKKVCRKHKIRVTIDLEDDVIDGKNVPLVIGTCIKKGRSRVFFVGKWKVKHGKAYAYKKRGSVIEAIVDLLEDPTVEKAMHHGSYDVNKIEKLLKCKIRGYTFDTEYSSYLADPNRKKAGLDEIGKTYAPQFGEYKTIILPEALPKGFDLKEHGLDKNTTLSQLHDYITAKGLLRLAQLPKKKIVIYNGADCDLTKHIEVATKKKVNLALLKVYCDAAFTIDEMTPNGPWFDYGHLKKLRKIYPPRLKRTLKSIRKIAGKPDFNPSSHPQMVWLFSEKLKLLTAVKYTNAKGKEAIKCSTDKGALERLAGKHLIARLVLEYRRIKKIITVYMDSFEDCANANGGRERTKWWMSGTATGRMSSGGHKGKRPKGETKIVNLQNVINDMLLQNLLVPDKHWRTLFDAIGKMVVKCIGTKYLKRISKCVEEINEEKDKIKKDILRKELEFHLESLKKKLYASKLFARLTKHIIRKFGKLKVMLGFDQGQIEVRVAAQISGDKHLIKDCKSGDIHTKVGVTITGWPAEKIAKDKKTRTSTKNAHFGILFGLSEDNLPPYVFSKDPDTTMSEEDIRKGYRRYFKRYPKIREMMQKLRKLAEQTGKVVSILGFERKLNVHEQGNSDDSEGEGFVGDTGAYWGNQAINTPVQGTAHILMFMAMASLRRAPKTWKKKILGVPGMEVHDFMGWWTELRNLEQAYSAGKRLLEKAPLKVVKSDFPRVKWKVPLKVEGKVGLRFGDSVEGEHTDSETGKAVMHSLPEMLVDMFLTTFQSEEKLRLELEKESA